MEVLLEFCREGGMQLNAKKTQFMTINGEANDREPLTSGYIKINYTKEYTYLGAKFDDTGKQAKIIKAHANKASKHVNKLASFCAKNARMPFQLKDKVFEAALLSAMLYSCESWLTNNTRDIELLYHRAMKTLLGVRTQTPNLLCRTELARPPLNALLTQRRARFMKKYLDSASGEEPLSVVWLLCERENTPGYRFLHTEMETGNEAVTTAIERQRDECRTRANTSTKVNSYVTINPRLEKHSMYNLTDYIPDNERKQWTRLRLSSHSLRIETGRWSRTPREERLCMCGTSIQDEDHAILRCPKTNDIRIQFAGDLVNQSDSLASFYSNVNLKSQCIMADKTLQILEK